MDKEWPQGFGGPILLLKADGIHFYVALPSYSVLSFKPEVPNMGVGTP